MAYISLSRIRNNKTLVNGGLFSLFSFFNRGIGFLLLIILGNYIMPKEYGQLSLFSTVLMFLSYFVGLTTAGYFSVTYFQVDNINRRKDFSVICTITVVMFTFICFLFLLFGDWLSIWLKVDVSLLFVAIAIAFCNVFVQMNLDYMRLQERVSVYGLLSCSYAIFNMILTLYFIIGCDLNWKGRIYAQLLGDISYFFIAIIWFYKSHLFCFVKEWTRYQTILAWGIPQIPHLATNWIRQGCDRYIIEGSYSVADVGLFSFALNLVNIIIMIGIAFNNTNSVNTYKILASDLSNEMKRTNLRKQETMMIYIYALASVGVVVAGSALVPIVLPKYKAAVPYFMVLSIFGFLQCMYLVYCNYLFYFRCTRQLMYFTFFSSLIHLALSLCFTRYSLYALCAIYSISFLLMVGMVRKKSRVLLDENLNI